MSHRDIHDQEPDGAEAASPVTWGGFLSADQIR